MKYIKPLILQDSSNIYDVINDNRFVDFKEKMLDLYGNKVKQNEMNYKILIFTRKYDPEITYIAPYLIKEKIDYIRIDIENIERELYFDFSINNNNKDLKIIYKKQEIDLSTIDLIWMRRFDYESFKIVDFPEESMNIFATNEWLSCLHYIFKMDEIKWINHPYKSKNLSKLYQLDVAKKIGFNIIDSVITNKKNIKINWSNIFLKPSSEHFYEYPFGYLNAVYGKMISFTELNLLNNIPSILQKKCNIKYETRVTIVGNKVFSAKIDTNFSHDWHKNNMEGILIKEIETPSSIKDKCLEFLNTVKLEYGAFDFIVDKDNQWKFLEVNPIGDWRWIEQNTNLLISNELIKLIQHLIEEEG
ncbi:MvdD-like protein with pre-ATP grasp domain [Staphylococcus saprophyticus]|uniref:MvdC/MvdD family ATP grasp protein n=1 Tax=Staphylococcus TaxID=1279 RepID=UPI0005DCB1BE|nr:MULTISPECIES: hypothetical protein [Staphylococcus]CPZ28336.1 Glutathione synthase/Ribosomal protein S6 modification enzyme (glutaminyl transferase) [Mycobacteroides abscessus]MBN6851822.1 hypothetical protein [Staphylococcus saprophyticus]MDW3893727.1 hypothetical protein [Staphylococcus saprophyticus]MDW3933418.1 hypothetical protein [Staphylococcus saprophyticus]MDW3958652.1 hypothetical protein [Staphylococcus saprophyticus]